LFETPTQTPSKNRAMGVALALSGQNIKGKHNNQPSVSIVGGRESGEVAHRGWSAWGNTVLLFGTSNGATQNYKNTIHGGIYWLSIGKPKHNNQPKIGVRDGGEHGGDIQQAGRVGEAWCHHFGGHCKLNRG
jgi:hypothetical protein